MFITSSDDLGSGHTYVLYVYLSIILIYEYVGGRLSKLEHL